MSQSPVRSHAPIARLSRSWRWMAALLALTLMLSACAGPSADPTATVPPAPTATQSQPAPSAAPEATATAGPPRATATNRPLLTATPRPTGTITPTRQPTSTSSAPTPAGPTGTPVVLSNPSTLTRVGAVTLKGQGTPLITIGGEDGKTLYAARVGVMRSGDGGATWGSIRSEDDAPKVTALVSAPSKPQMLYIGVNESCSKTSKQPGWMSIDGGDTWKQFGDGIVSLAVDPNDAETVYAIDCEGLKRTTDGGEGWETLTVPKLTGGTKAIIGIAPSDADHLYLAIPVGAVTMAIVHSADRGETWKGVTPSITAEVQSDETLKGGDRNTARSAPLGIAVDADNPLTVLISTSYGVFRSDDAGVTWHRLDDGLESTVPRGALPSDQEGVRMNTALVADSERTGAFWVGTGTTKLKGVGLYRTRNSGESWRKSISGLEGKQIYALALGGEPGERILFIATDDGMWSLTAP